MQLQQRYLRRRHFKMINDENNDNNTYYIANTWKMVKSRVRRVGHMVRTKDEHLRRELRQRRRQRGSPQFKWENCLKRRVRKAVEEGIRRETVSNRGNVRAGWKEIDTLIAVADSGGPGPPFGKA